MSLNPIRDQAYQFFQQEALELLQTLETGLLTLKDEFTVPKVHNLMRAAHSIKGGAASVDLPGIQKIAHKLEDVLRALYRREGSIDPDLDEALLLAYDCLRVPLQTQISTGTYDEAAAWNTAEPIFALLETFLSDALGANIELPTAAELGVDMTYEVFTGDVAQGLERLERILSNPQAHEVRGEIYTTAEVFIGLGELLSLPGFAAIGHQILQALQRHPQESLTIGHIAVENLRAAQQAVLAGDRTEGGSPSPELLAFATPSLDLTFNEGTIDFSCADATISDMTVDQVELDFTAFVAASSAHTPAMSDVTTELWELDLTDDTEEPSLHDAAISAVTTALLRLDVTDLTAIQSVSEPAEVLLEDIFGQVDCQPAIDLSPDALLLDHTLAIPLANTENIATKASELAVSPIVLLSPGVRSPQPITPQLNESVRVDSTRLERINNLVGELVTQENGSLLQSQQLQGQLKTLQQRFNRFEQFTKKLEAWMDQSQRVEVRSRRLSEADVLANSSLNAAEFKAPATALLSPNPDSGGLRLNFDPLQMDSYSDLYTIVQAGVEEIHQMSETMRDMTLITQQSQQTQRKKQQTLKQVRNDLLWARMMPVGELLVRFPRMIRDLANQYQKQVNFMQTGGATLIDKRTLEKLYDPLVHLIRNAFDHGTEPPEVRLAQGKAPEATIEIRAYHRGNQTFIEVQDDGRGIDLEKVRTAAITQGLLSTAEAAEATPEQLYQALFFAQFFDCTCG